MKDFINHGSESVEVECPKCGSKNTHHLKADDFTCADCGNDWCHNWDEVTA